MAGARASEPDAEALAAGTGDVEARAGVDAEARTIASLPTLPGHVAIIMDGNGRWAKRRLWDRLRGHNVGAEVVRNITTACANTSGRIEQLTLYAFSSENWARPKLEVDALMELLKRYLRQELDTFNKNNIRFIAIGRWTELPKACVKAVADTIEATSGNTGMLLCLALNYGARSEIVDATRAIASEVAAGRLDPDAIDESTIAAHLHQPEMPEPDLLIRTAGEFRLSNFLLWQVSYAELYVTSVLWPDFTEGDLYDAFVAFSQRERRFGGLRG